MHSDSVTSFGGARLEFVHALSRSAFGERHLALRSSVTAPPQTLLVRSLPLGADGTSDDERLQRAALNSLSFRHSHLLRVLGIERTRSDLLIVSEWTEGVNLTSLRRHLLESATPTPLALIVRLALDLAESAALVRAEHPQARTMRLIWNDGTLVATSGRLILTDPGILSSLAASRGSSWPPAILMELTPEELENGVPVESSDVFAVGTLMWELLAHRPLCTGESLKLRGRGKYVAVPTLQEATRSGTLIPARLRQIVEKSTRLEPGQRLQSTALLAAELAGLAPEIRATPLDVRALLNRLAGPQLIDQRLAREHALANEQNRFQRAVHQSLSAPPCPPNPTEDTFSAREAPTRPDTASSCSHPHASVRYPTPPNVSGFVLARQTPAQAIAADGSNRFGKR